MESKIYSFFIKLFTALGVWFDESRFGKIFNHMSSFLANSFKNSFVGKFFNKTDDDSILFDSLFWKTITFPVFVLQKIAVKVSPKVKAISKKSALIFCADNFELISTKIYGSITLAFALTHFVIKSLTNQFSLSVLAFDSLVVVISVLLILVNRSLKSLFKGSSLLLSFGGMFAKTKKESSKLFLNENEIELDVSFVSVIVGVFLGVFAAILPFKIFTLLFCGTIGTLLVLRYVELGVYIAVIFSPFLPTMVLAALSVLCLMSLALKIATDKDFVLKKNSLNFFVVIFLGAALYGCINSFHFESSLKIFFIYFAFIMFYFVIVNTITTAKKWRALVTGFIFAAALVALYGVVQNFTGIASTESWVDEEMFSQIKTRVYSTFGNPNVLGEFLVIMIPAGLALAWGNRHLGHKLVYTVFVLIMCACIVFTWSRGAWLGVMASVVVFFLVMEKKWFLAGFLGLFLLPVLLGSNSAIASRLLSIGDTKDTSTAYRVSIWMASVNLIKKFWMSGIGLGSDSFTMIYPKFALAGANYALHSHNLFLQLTVEMGIIGIGSFVCLLLSYIRHAMSIVIYKTRKRLIPMVTLSFGAGVLGYMLQGLTDNVWYNYKMMFIFWAVVALTSSAYNIIKNKDDTL